jgi:hypothetical protein
VTGKKQKWQRASKNTTTNNNQAFESQQSWARLVSKPNKTGKWRRLSTMLSMKKVSMLSIGYQPMQQAMKRVSWQRACIVMDVTETPQDWKIQNSMTQLTTVLLENLRTSINNLYKVVIISHSNFKTKNKCISHKTKQPNSL